MSAKLIRKNSHAGSWYSDSSNELYNQLSNWLERAGTSLHGPARVIIAPHAGYTYSGACAAHAYKEIDSNKVKRVFIIGPSHHISINGCALSPADIYETPLYNLKLDKDLIQKLLETNKFHQISMIADEDEHSIEMHLPYIAKIMQDREFKIVPIIVGSLNSSREQVYGQIFSEYLADEENLFVISSDFCHWGSRFNYQYYDNSWGNVYESIEKLDRMGMDLIETCKPDLFRNYLQKFGNTICGRNPILLILNAVQNLLKSNPNLELKLKFLNYAQSSKCRNNKDSSVSYAAASLVIVQK